MPQQGEVMKDFEKVSTETFDRSYDEMIIVSGLTVYNEDGKMLVTNEVLDLPILAQPKDGYRALITISYELKK